MTDLRPDLTELVGDVTPEERERLGLVHALLLEVGAPPELSPILAEPPAPPGAEILRFPRRRAITAIAAAAAAIALIFTSGWFFGAASRDRAPERSVAMTGPAGVAVLDVFAADDAGNWPMELRAQMAVLPSGERYELWLTRDGKLADPCGTFVAHAGETVVPLNAPYKLKGYTGWVVVVEGSDEFVLRTPTV